MNRKKTALLILLVGLVLLFFYFGLHQHINLKYIQTQQDAITLYQSKYPLHASLLFFLVYIAITALSLPGAAIMTLAGGAIFGLLLGTILVSFASTIGATLAFLVSRYLFREVLQRRFSKKLEIINQGIEQDGAFYLFTARLVPIIPFFIVNLVMGLTPIKTLTFALVSQAGMLAATIIFVNAGTQLAQIKSLEDIFSPELIISLTLLGIFPLAAKKMIDLIQSRRLVQHHETIRKAKKI